MILNYNLVKEEEKKLSVKYFKSISVEKKFELLNEMHDFAQDFKNKIINKNHNHINMLISRSLNFKKVFEANKC